MAGLRTLVILAGITIVVIIAAIITSVSRAPQSGKDKPLLFPSLEDNINNTAEVVITGRGRTVNLVRQDDQWTVQQAGGYPADFDRLKRVLVSMASLRVLSEKTGNPELYPRLGVEDPEGNNASSHLVVLKDDAGETMAGLILGDVRRGSPSAGQSGVYVRKPGQAQSLLAEGDLSVSSQTIDWFNQQLFSITPSRIESITTTHPDGETVTVSRAERGGDFTVRPVPDGHQPQSRVILERTGTILEDTFAVNVASADEFTFPQDHIRTTIRTFDGLVAETQNVRQDGRNHVRFSFSVDESRLPEENESSGEDGAADTGRGKPGVREQAENYNNTVSGWVFTLPDPDYNLFVRRISDLTRPE